jgi:hypothetical protein
MYRWNETDWWAASGYGSFCVSWWKLEGEGCYCRSATASVWKWMPERGRYIWNILAEKKTHLPASSNPPLTSLPPYPPPHEYMYIQRAGRRSKLPSKIFHFLSSYVGQGESFFSCSSIFISLECITNVGLHQPATSKIKKYEDDLSLIFFRSSLLKNWPGQWVRMLLSARTSAERRTCCLNDKSNCQIKAQKKDCY